MVRVGEMGGIIPQIMEKLAQFMERSQEIRRFIISSSIYPAILLFVGVVSVLVIMGFVVPRFAGIFNDLGQEIPLSTTVLIHMSEFLRGCGNGLLVVIGNPLGCAVAYAVIKHMVDNVVENNVIKDSIVNIRDQVKGGQRISEMMKKQEAFPEMAVQMVALGEETGRLGEMLVLVAEELDNKIQGKIRTCLAFLEPATILLMGLIIGGIVVSMLSAIFGINEIQF